MTNEKQTDRDGREERDDRADQADRASHRAVTDALGDLVAAGEPLVVVDSPPGAGKTTTIVATAARAAQDGQAVAVAVSTNAQAVDLARRLAAAHPRLPLTVCTGNGSRVTPPARRTDGSRPWTLVAGAVPQSAPGTVTVANTAMWSWHPEPAQDRTRPYGLMLVDEAYQAPWHVLRLVGRLAGRHVLVGDPGQILPFSPVEQERWHGDPTGPLVPGAAAALRLAPHAPVLRLPLTWRLPPGTTSVIGPVLYPRLRFRSSAAAGRRRLQAGGPGGLLLSRADDPSLAVWALPPADPDPVDPVLCAAAADAVASVCDGRTVVADEDGCRVLAPGDCAVVVARNQQAAAVRRALHPRLAAVTVTTANRVQGLGFDFVVAVDPLVGAPALDAFHLDPGRLCVQLSRHRVACLFLTRRDVADRLAAHLPASPRHLGEEDREHHGLQAHLDVRAVLRDAS